MAASGERVTSPTLSEKQVFQPVSGERLTTKILNDVQQTASVRVAIGNFSLNHLFRFYSETNEKKLENRERNVNELVYNRERLFFGRHIQEEIMAYAAVIDVREIAEKKMATFKAAMKLREARLAKEAEEAKNAKKEAGDKK